MKAFSYVDLSDDASALRVWIRFIVLAGSVFLSACHVTPPAAPIVVAEPARVLDIESDSALGSPADTAVARKAALPANVKPLSQYECAEQLPLVHRVGQLMFPLMTQTDFAQANELASAGKLGGVVVLGSPGASVREDIAQFQRRSLFGPAIIAVDEEGGRVQRLSRLTSPMPSARKIARSMSPGEARQLAARHARAIGEFGFTMNLAPVADLDYSRAIGDRSFGKDAMLVSDYALATADGIIDAGLVPVLKHFPGHGRGSDSHFGLPVIPAVQVLQNKDLIPFSKASERNDIPIMIGHLVVEGLTNGKPASISSAAVDGLLRRELGFDGLVITDAFNMDAIATSLSDIEAAELSIAAGVDLIMLSSVSDVPSVVGHVVNAVADGRISKHSITESFLRVMDTRNIDVCGLTSRSS